jgi:hypothetical protein
MASAAAAAGAGAGAGAAAKAPTPADAKKVECPAEPELDLELDFGEEQYNEGPSEQEMRAAAARGRALKMSHDQLIEAYVALSEKMYDTEVSSQCWEASASEHLRRTKELEVAIFAVDAKGTVSLRPQHELRAYFREYYPNLKHAGNNVFVRNSNPRGRRGRPLLF